MLSLQSLHDAEIPFSITCLPDGGWVVTMGDPERARAFVGSEAEAMSWLGRMALELYGFDPAKSAESPGNVGDLA